MGDGDARRGRARLPDPHSALRRARTSPRYEAGPTLTPLSAAVLPPLRAWRVNVIGNY